MPGRPVLAAVLSWRSLTRACARPLVRDFQAWGPSSRMTRMPRTAQRWLRRPARILASTEPAARFESSPGGMEGMISQSMGDWVVSNSSGRINIGLKRRPGVSSTMSGELEERSRLSTTMPGSDQRRVARSTERTATV